jgi:hypothetical protein
VIKRHGEGSTARLSMLAEEEKHMDGEMQSFV